MSMRARATDIESLKLSWSEPVYNTISVMLINKLLVDLLPNDVQLLPMDWFAPFTVYVYSSIFIGFTISSPLIIYEFYKFFKPALHSNERRYIGIFAISFSVLFLAGISMGYILVLPMTLKVLLASTHLLGLPAIYEFASFFSLTLGLLTVCGLAFTFPIFFLLLVKLKIIKTELITKTRKIVYVTIFTLICILTPDPTIVTDIIIFLPLVVLLEGSILIGKRIEMKDVSR